MSVELPLPGIVDIRMPILGDSFTWAGIEPTAAKKSIVIHATASPAPQEDGFSMAEYHVNTNGWGGVGVHFIVTKDGYGGRAGETPGGAQVQYVGDLGTWRAGCLDQNPGRVHIEISGLFTPGNGVPSETQLRKTRELIDFMLAPNNILPSLNYYSQVTYHNAVPGQNTACPGWAHPQFHEWFSYLQGGPEPSWWAAPVVGPVAPEPTSVASTPVVPEPVAPEPIIGEGSAALPEYKTSYVVQSETKTTTVESHAVDMTGAGAPITVAPNTMINTVGYFTDNGKTYYRSDKSIITDGAKGTWYGLSVDAFASGYADGIIPVNVIKKESLLISKFFALIFSPVIKLFSKGK